MKRTKLLLLILVMLIPMMANADPIEIDGIWYNLISKANVAEVTRNPSLPSYQGTYSDEVVIPDKVTYGGVEYNVTTIGKYAFSSCKSMTSVSIPNSITSIGCGAFEDCSGLTSVTIPNSVTSIDILAFQNCSGLTSVSIPNSVTFIGSAAFKRCSGLTSVTIPNSVTSIEMNTFENCSGLTSVSIPNSVTSIGYAAFSCCSSLTFVTIPSSVTSIDSYAFLSCKSMTSVSIPNSVTSIGSGVFAGCSNLKTITIGSGLKKISMKAFSECTELTDVYCYSKNVPNTNSNAFEGSYIEHVTLHVPEGSLDAYKAAEPWKNFKGIVEIGAPKYVLSYIVDGKEYKKIEKEEGAAITPEATPIKEGYTFSGWSEIPSTMPANDVNVTGTFSINKYNLIYKVDGADYKNYVEYGASITPETSPTKEGYTFSGWSEIPATMPANDVNVTGSFSINKYKLVYKVDGADYKSYEVEYGAAITPETAPTKVGNTFSGWSEIPETMPANNVTVTGTFSVNKYKLLYKVDGADYKNYEVEYGASITPEAAPTMEGYTFSGWGEIPATMPANDVTITGTFTKGAFKLTYIVDGQTYKTLNYDYEAAITPEEAPTKVGYTFSGWSEIPATMPANDVNVTGTFSINKYNLIYKVDGADYKNYAPQKKDSISLAGAKSLLRCLRMM